MANASSVAVKPAPVAAVAAPVKSVAVKPARYPESAVITLTEKGAAGNPKRAASAKRYALYLAAAAAGTPLTVGAYLDGCLALNPDEPRYRWRADFSWDIARGYISIA